MYDIPAKQAEIKAQLEDLARQRTEAQALLSNIVDRQVYLSGQYALLDEMQQAEIPAPSPDP
jgi:hypothetical protein